MKTKVVLLLALLGVMWACDNNKQAGGGIWDETENTLALQVVDSLGMPVINARVRLVSNKTWSEKIFAGENTIVDSGFSDSKGWVALRTDSWPASVEVNAGTLVARSWVIEGGDSIQSTVGKPAILRGSLVVSSQPMPALMRLYGTTFEAQVQQDGSFSFDSLPQGQYALVTSQGNELLMWGQGLLSDSMVVTMDSLSPCDRDSVLMDDFEDKEEANRFHAVTGAGWWYTYSDSLSSVEPSSFREGLVLSEESWNGTQSYHASYNVDTTGSGAYALCGFDIGISRLMDSTATYDLSGVDSISFWAKGQGNIVLQMYGLRTLEADSMGKWDYSFTLSWEWTRFVVVPDENWSNVATYANTFTFLSQKDAEIWLDQIVFHGISAADIYPFQLRSAL